MKRKLCLALAFFLLLVCVLPSRASALPETVKPSGGGSSASSPSAPSSSPGKTEVQVDGASTALFYVNSFDLTGSYLDVGTGVMISSDGKAVTTYRAIKNAHRLKITFLDKSEYEVESVLGYDIEKDIAIIKLKGKDFPYLKLADSSKTAKNDEVYEVDYAGIEHLRKDTVVNPAAVCDDGRTLIQISNEPGMDGGALLNSAGGLIGLVVKTKLGGKAQGFAIPSAQLMAVSQKTPKKISEVAADYEVYCYKRMDQVSKNIVKTKDMNRWQFLVNGTVAEGSTDDYNTVFYIQCSMPGEIYLSALSLSGSMSNSYMNIDGMDKNKGAVHKVGSGSGRLTARFHIDKPMVFKIIIDQYERAFSKPQAWKFRLTYTFKPDGV